MDNIGKMEESAHVIANELTKQVKTEDIFTMVSAQREMLMRYEKTNEMLLYFNMLSKSCYDSTAQQMKLHTQMLSQMKQDLDSIFRRIRLLKGHLQKMHSVAFAACHVTYNVEEGDNNSTDKLTNNPQVNVESCGTVSHTNYNNVANHAVGTSESKPENQQTET